MFKKTIIILFISIILLTTLFFSIELVLRIKGHQPFIAGALPKIIPGGKLYNKNSLLGFVPIAGKYTVVYPDNFKYALTYLPNLTRITQPLENYSKTEHKPEIWIFGDSFVNGQSLNDNQTFPWILQEKFPQYRIVNYGVGGYSTVQSLLQFKEALKTKIPAVVILGYSDFLDQRNIFSRSWRKAESLVNKLGQVSQPYATIDANGKLKYLFDDITYREFPLEKQLAFPNWLDNKSNALEDKINSGHNVTKALLKEFYTNAYKNKIKVIFATFYNNPASNDTLNYAKNLGMETVDISVDYQNPKYTNLPHDAHPSALSDRIFAQKLQTKILEQIH